ncbi:CocE/NonD family hydrolase [Thermodesulfobacteriota bacterium]
MTHSLHIEENVPTEMRDGTALRSDIYRPYDNGRHPAILIRSFDKTRFGRLSGGRLMDIIDLVQSGYAFVTQDMRGRHASEGEWKPEEMLKVEGRDGYDSVEWIAGQNWCDGNVGMLGYSHASRCAWLAASESPPHLKAIAPWSFGAPVGQRRSVPPISSGVISLILSLSWLINEAPDAVDRLERDGHDVTEMRRTLDHAMLNPAAYYNYLPLKNIPFARFDRIAQLWNSQLHPAISAGVAGSAGQQTFREIMLPCSFQCGWYDGNGWATLETFRNMTEKAGPRNNPHLLVGAWLHGLPANHLGSMNFGRQAAGPYGRMPISEYLKNFFDKYLRGKDKEIPVVTYFIMGRNEWREADAWPLPKTQWQRFFFHSKGAANTAAGDGLLSLDEPGSESPDRFIYDPLNPVPTVGGRIISAPAGFGFVAGPLEQSAVEKRHDVLCYTTPELREDVEVTGPLEIHLFAATSVESTDFTAKLVDVYPDGRAHNVADGITRISSAGSAENQTVKHDGVYELVIGMGYTSQLFREGHSIRIDISSSNFPLYERNMNTGNPVGEDADGIPAMQMVFHQSEYASYIDLPVIPAGSA